MKRLNRIILSALLWLPAGAYAQPEFFPPPPGGPGGFGGRRGPGGPGGAMEERKVVKDFDRDGDKRLNAEERKAARAFLESNGGGFGPPGRGPRGRGGPAGSPSAGQKLAPGDIRNYGSEPLYDTGTLRTLFLEFEAADWEAELETFHNTDVEVPAALTVDGKKYPGVGVHFRGMSSYMNAGRGYKRSLNLALDFIDKDQRLGGFRTLNLLNANGDPSFLRSVLFLEIARDYLPAPRANFVRVVINGESWGIYTSQEQFNTDFIQEHFGVREGARWKVPGSPGGRGGLEYLGSNAAAYKRIYEIKSKDDPKSWEALIQLCKVLNETAPDKLEQALEPLLDVDGALRFLAVEKALINSDGYWIRASDYSLYQDTGGKFHVFPHDANETLREAEGGPGMRGGGAGGVELDPLAGANDSSKPLISKLLAVPALRTRYLGYVRDIAERWLSWDKLGPIAERYHQLIAADVKGDTRKLDTTEAFEGSLTVDAAGGGRGFRGPGGGARLSLKSFAERRRVYLLGLEER